jgi:hypothetical protein
VLGHVGAAVPRAGPVKRQWCGATRRKMEVHKHRFAGLIVGVAEGTLVVRSRLGLLRCAISDLANISEV